MPSLIEEAGPSAGGARQPGIRDARNSLEGQYPHEKQNQPSQTAEEWAAEHGPKLIWQAQTGPQSDLITCPIFEVFFGGARGGGKTDGTLGDWMGHSGTYGEAAVGVFFRKTFVQLSEVIARTQYLFPKIGGKWRGDIATWTMPGKSRLLFRHLEKDSHAENYQGHNYTRLYFEELTNHPTPGPYNKLKATLRSASGVPTGVRSTGNPGGPGHNWVKTRFITPNPAGYQILTEDYENPYTKEIVTLERVFIPSRLKDNALLMQNDPTYVAKLQQAGSKALVQAWLHGDWSIIDGAFFAEFNPEKHILPSSILGEIPSHLKAFRAMDWGYAKPFSVGWYVVSDGTFGLPTRALIKVQEWYGIKDGMPNEGLRLDPGEVAKGIKERDRQLADLYGWRTSVAVADPSMFARTRGPSIAEEMSNYGVYFTRADNKRIPGWQQMRRRFNGTAGQPLLYFVETCHDSIRTIPTLQHDENDVEDLDTDGEDHAADETRYACMSRPWVTAAPTPEAPHRAENSLTFAEVMNGIRAKRLQTGLR